MLTRRAFTGFVPCAICAITSEFFVTEAAAQTTPPAATPGVTRKILSHPSGGTRTLGSNRPMSWKAASTPHAGGPPGSSRSRILITYVVEKGKPLASPA